MSLPDGAGVVRRVELVEVEVSSRLGLPESQVVGVPSVVTWNRVVVGHGNDLLAALPLGSFSAAVLVLLRVAVEADLVSDVLSLDLPGVAVVEPEVWDLNLVAVSDLLLEDTVVVSNTVAPSRDFECGEGVDEASSESAETSVSEGSVTLLLVEVLQLVAHVHESSLEVLLEVEVDKSVLECSTHEELKGKIVNTRSVLVLVVGLGVVPGLNESISDGQGSSLVSSEIVEVEAGSGERELNVVDDLLLDGLLVGLHVGTHEFPQFLLLLFSGIVTIVKLGLNTESVQVTSLTLYKLVSEFYSSNLEPVFFYLDNGLFISGGACMFYLR